MKKISLLFAMLTMVVSGAWAKDGVTVISFSNTSTSISGYGITDGIQYTEGASAPATTTITTASGATATLTISSGKIWTNSIAGTWSNTYAIEDINTELTTTLTADQFSTNTALKLASSAAGGSKVSVAITLPSGDAGKKITLYAVMGARESALDNISVTGITGATYSYATNTGSGFSSEAAYSEGALNPTIVKITGTTTGSFTVTSSTNKSAIALLAYKLTSDLDALKTAVKAELAKIGTPVIDERTALETKLAVAEAGTATYDELYSAYSAYTTAVASSTVSTLYLPDGYYKMKSVATDRTKLYLYNNYLKTTGYNGITLQSADAVTTNNGIWKITNNSTSVAIVNGEGTKLVRGNQNATTVTSASNVTAMSSLTFGDYNNTQYTSMGGIYFTEGLNCSNQGYTVTIDETATNFLTTWAGQAGAKDDRWTFEAVDMGTVYTVNISGAEGAYITRTSTSEIALNGGFFAYGTTTPTSDDFTYYDTDTYAHTISIDTQNHTITVNYTESPEHQYSRLCSDADAALAKADIVGYPTSNSSVYKTLSEFKGGEWPTYSSDNLKKLTSYLNDYKTVTTDITLPEDGKAYYIINGQYNSNSVMEANKYILYNNNNSIAVKAYSADALDNSCIWIVRKVADGYYALISATGNYGYMHWTDNTTNNQALSTTYTNTQAYTSNYMHIAKIVGGTSNVVPTKEQLFGYLSLRGYRSAEMTDAALIFAGASAGFNKTNADIVRYLSGNNVSQYSTAVQFVEVPSYTTNQATLKAPKTSDGKVYSTICLPYATKTPDDVTAYTCSLNGTALHLDEIENGDIPANTGCVLIAEGTSAVTATLAPSIANPTAITSNVLDGTLAEKQTSTLGSSVYVLNGGQAAGIGFYPYSQTATIPAYKAYYAPTEEAARSFYLFGEDQTTGIESLIEKQSMTDGKFVENGRVIIVKGGVKYNTAGQKMN